MRTVAVWFVRFSAWAHEKSAESVKVAAHLREQAASLAGRPSGGIDGR